MASIGSSNTVVQTQISQQIIMLFPTDNHGPQKVES